MNNLGFTWRAAVVAALLGMVGALSIGCKKESATTGETAKPAGEGAGTGAGEAGKAGAAAGEAAAKPATEAPAGEAAKPAETPPAAAGVPFESKEGKFSAVFPSAPEASTLPTPTALGNIDQKMFSVSKGDAFFAASFADYPAEAMKGQDLKKILDGARDGAAQNIQGKVTSESEIKIGAHTGRDVRIEATVQGISVVANIRFYLVENRLYQMLVVRPGAAGVSDDEVKQFLDSFKLLSA